jgi:hypothetical protein
MRSTAAVFALGLALAVVVSHLGARAAWAGPEDMQFHGYVEPCTVGNVQEMYTECELCQVPPHGDPEVCAGRLAPLHYQKKCQTRADASGWGEVWCVDKRRPPEAAGPSKALVAGAIVAVVGLSLIARLAWSRRRAAK